MRLTMIALAGMLVSGCVAHTQDVAAPGTSATAEVGAPLPAHGDKVVLASTMEVRVDTTAVGGISPSKLGERLALMLATITEYQPEHGTAVTPIRSAVTSPDGAGGTSLKVVYYENAYRQTAWLHDYGKVMLDRRVVDPGWYLVHSYGSTAGFEMYKPRVGQKACLLYGGKPAPGVEPVALKAGDVGYFGHFVFTISVKPSKDPAAPYALWVDDATIDPAPANLDDLLRQDGIHPAHVVRIPRDRFPCPWTVPRTASNSLPTAG